MKIQNDGGISSNTVGDTTHISPRPKPARVSEQPAEEKVDTSSVSIDLTADPDRLERLHEAVQDGTYSVPADELARRIVQHHLHEVSKPS
jgi:anti-sigma28 factor (negative regulator of flagellin synthesis)